MWGDISIHLKNIKIFRGKQEFKEAEVWRKQATVLKKPLRRNVYMQLIDNAENILQQRRTDEAVSARSSD